MTTWPTLFGNFFREHRPQRRTASLGALARDVLGSWLVAGKRNAWEWFGLVVGVAGGVTTMVASFFLAAEDHYPGAFYIERQALWDDNHYGVKLTFLLTWFTLLNLVVVPMLFVAGVAALARSLRPPLAQAPAGWDLQQTARRLKMGAAAVVLLPVWAVLTGIVVFAPEWLSPLGGFASILLLPVPILPMAGPALLFEAIIPPSYVEGVIEGMRVTRHRNRTTVHLHVAGRSYATVPGMAQGLGDGMHVGLLATGFLKKVRRLVRLA